MNNYLESLEVGTKVKLTVKKGERDYYYIGTILENSGSMEYIVVKDKNGKEVYSVYDRVMDLEVQESE